MSARERDAALATAGTAVMVANWLSERFSLPETEVPDLADITPETAARMVRAEWGLGEAPLRNVIHLLELHGIRVFALPNPSRKLDAFSFWIEGEPFVLLNTTTSSERSRMDLAHELAHLALHRVGRDDHVRCEQEAARFASAFLMPESSVLSLGRTTWTIAALRQAKKIWGVSLSALARRVHDLNLMSDWNYHTICVQLSEAGYRRQEPEPMPRESSQLLQKALVMLRDTREGIKQMAEDLRMHVHDLNDLLFHLVPLRIDGSSEASEARSSPGAALRLIREEIL